MKKKKSCLFNYFFIILIKHKYKENLLMKQNETRRTNKRKNKRLNGLLKFLLQTL